ncbi:MAG: ABC transporter substrate-binding protein [Longimicrobiaceae bacterium]
MKRQLLPWAVLFALALLPGCGDAGRDALTFGLAGPFGESYGASMQDGAELARDEINRAGGVNGRPLEFLARDDGADPEQGIEVSQELLAAPQVVAVIGHVNSGVVTASAPIYDRGLPAVATSATAPVIGQLSDWLFRVASSDSANAVALAERSAELAADRTGLLYENNAYGRGLALSFITALAGFGAAPLETDPYLESTEDFYPYLERLRRQGVRLIFIAGLQAGAAEIISQAREMGIDARFIGGDGVEGLVTMGETYNGTLVGLMYHPDASPRAAEFAELFRAEYGREPDSFAALAYDAVMLVARAAEEGGASRSAIRDYLAGVGRDGGSEPYRGVAGTIRFDQHGDPVDKRFDIGVIRDGEIVLAPSQ